MSLLSQQAQPLEVFLAYAPAEDEDLCRELEKHLTVLLRQGLITSWHEHNIIAGAEREQEIRRHFTHAHLILLLISSGFLASDFCYDIVMAQALERHNTRDAHVIPILLRPASWNETPLSKLQVLPRNETPISLWHSRDDAWLHITQELRVVIANLAKNKQEREAPHSSHLPMPAVIAQAPFLIDPAIPETLGRSNNLLGRDNLLKQIKQRLLEGGSLALTALNGLPGIGKTALAVALATDEQIRVHFHDGILWAGLGPNANVLGLLARWGRLLGIKPIDVENATDWASWNHALQATIGSRHLLLVIDDAWTTEEALALKIEGPHCTHLLTTRLPPVAFDFTQEGIITVSELEETDGLIMLTRSVRQLVEQDPEGAQALVRAVGGLPLAIKLMSHYLASQAFAGQPRRLQTALARLRDAEQRLHLNVPIALKERSPNLSNSSYLSLQAAIAVSDQQLSPQAHTALCALSVFPPKPNSFSEEAALAVIQEQEEVLDALWDAGLLESGEPGRYTLHQTIVDYARSQTKDTIAQQQLIHYILKYIKKCQLDCDKLEQEIMNIQAALDNAIALGMHSEFLVGVTALSYFMRVRGRYALADQYLQLALQATKELEDQVGYMTILRYLAAFAELRGEHVQAENYGQQGLFLARQLGRIDAVSDLLTTLGQVAFYRGDHVQSQTFFEEGLELARQLGYNEQVCTLLNDLGTIARYQANFAAAVTFYQEGLVLARQSGHQELISSLLSSLGWVATREANYVQAEQYCLEGLPLAHQLGHRANECTLLNTLGAIACERGNFEQAEAYNQEALKLARQIGHREYIITTLSNLGIILTFPFQNKYDQAEGYLREARDLAQQVGSHNARPFLLACLGSTIGAKGDYSQANMYFQESLDLSRRLGMAWEIGATLILRGLLQLKYEQIDAATETFDEVITLSKHYTKWDPQFIAGAQFGLAQIAAHHGDMNKAYRLGRHSLALFEATGHSWAEKVKQWLNSIGGNEETPDETFTN